MSHNYSILKIDAISDICKDAGQVFLATMFIDPIVSKNTNVATILIAIGLMCVSWSIGLSLSDK